MSFEMKYDVNGIPVRQAAPDLGEIAPVVDAVIDRLSATEEIDSDTEIVTPEIETSEPEIAPVKRPSAAQESWKSVRDKLSRTERERDEYARIIEESKRIPLPEEPEEKDVEDDALVEGKHLSKIQKEVKKLKQELSQYKQQSARDTTEINLKAKYPDFDSIVSADNIAILRDQYPELAASINSNPDLYSKAVSAYTMIKKLSGAEDQRVGDQTQDLYLREKAAAIKNLAKPKPLVSIAPQQGDSPLSRANAFASGLTPELKAELLKEMYAARSR